MIEPGARHLGLFAATAIGGGGIAFLTAASFAEFAVRFPQSGGTYTYAKRVLSIAFCAEIQPTVYAAFRW